MKIGRQSTGEDHIVNLVELPHLFISHSTDVQLRQLFAALVAETQASWVFISCFISNRRLSGIVRAYLPTNRMFPEIPLTDNIDEKPFTVDEFIALLAAEAKERFESIKRRKAVAKGLVPIVIFIDNIFDVIMSTRKKTPLSLIKLLITGTNVNMQFILGSSGTYRNLLDQLINVTPQLQKKLAKPMRALPVNHPLGAELVINPDGLLFFREKDDKIYQSLYP